MFGRRKQSQIQEVHTFDPDKERAILRCSICNGEQVFGFRNLKDGTFTEVSLVRSEHELDELKRKYGISEITKEY